MSSLSSTISSLASITEDSTFGVEGEDTPPSVPRRRKSLGSSSIASSEAKKLVESLESIHEDESPRLLNSADSVRDKRDKWHKPTRRSGRSDGARNISSSHRGGSKQRRSHSSKTTKPEREAEAQNENKTESRKRSQRSRRAQSLCQEAPTGERNNRDGGQQEAIEVPRISNRRKSSSSEQRSSSRSSKQDTADSSAGPQEKAKERDTRELSGSKRSSTRSSSSSQRDSSSQNRHRRSRSTRSSSHRSLLSSQGSSVSSISERSSKSEGTSANKEDASIKDAASNQNIVGETRCDSYSTSQHRHRHSHSHRHRHRHRHSHSKSSLSLSSRQVDWTGASRSLDRHGTQHELQTSSSDSDASRDLEDETPGAYRISTHSRTSRVLSVASSIASNNAPSFSVENDDDLTNSTCSISYTRTSASFNTILRAEATPDIADEIAAAREQGRTEAFTEVETRGAPIVVAVPQPRRPKAGIVGGDSRKRRVLMALAFCCFLLIVVSGTLAYFMVGDSEVNGLNVNATADQGDEDSELIAEISFDPPTAADCASVANGTDVIGQDDMFTQYVDMYLEITTNSEEDAAVLLALLKQQIQLRLLPLLIGCDELDGNVIGNGVIDSVSNSTSPCLFRGNPNCEEVMLTIKIYLRRKDDGTIAVEIMNDLLLGEDLNESLDLPPSVKTASVSLIIPSPSTETPTASPSVWVPDSIGGPPSPMADSSVPTVAPVARQRPSTSTPIPTMIPTLRITSDPTSTPVQVPAPVPTSSPILDSGADLPPRPVAVSTPEPTSDQAPEQTDQPTIVPTRNLTPGPTPMPIPGSTPLPTMPSTSSPTALPSPIPTARPTRLPTKLPSRTPSSNPTDTPSVIPSLLPSADPSISSTMLPSIQPSMCTIDTRIVPLFDEGEGAYKQVSPGVVSTEIQRFSCRAGATTDLAIVSFADGTGCAVECLFTIPFSSFETYCNENPAGGFTFSIPGPFTPTTELYIGNVAVDFDLASQGQRPILNFDGDSIGCYADSFPRAMNGIEKLESDTMTVQQCLNRCFDAGFSYSGLVGRINCYCDDDYMRYGKLPDSRCNRNCIDGMPCGSGWVISVYPTGVDGHDGEYTPFPTAAPVGELGCWQEDPAMVEELDCTTATYVIAANPTKQVVQLLLVTKIVLEFAEDQILGVFMIQQLNIEGTSVMLKQIFYKLLPQ
ncbi:MAG: hypothetical protein SGBAC_011335 [Bacillariaceae sp.]